MSIAKLTFSCSVYLATQFRRIEKQSCSYVLPASWAIFRQQQSSSKRVLSLLSLSLYDTVYVCIYSITNKCKNKKNWVIPATNGNRNEVDEVWCIRSVNLIEQYEDKVAEGNPSKRKMTNQNL